MGDIKGNRQAKPQLHQSALDMLFRCGEQYYRRYVLGEKIPPAVAAVIGSATHKSVQMDLHNFIEAGELLSVDHVQDIARDDLERIWSRGVKLDDEEIRRGIKAVKAEAVDMSVSLSKLHRTDIAPNLTPTHVERQFVVKLNGYPMDLAGTIDIQEGSTRIRDTKTAARTPSQNDVDTSIQLTMYGMAVKVIDNQAPRELAVDALVKTKVPKAVTISTTRTDDDFMMLLRRIERAIRIVEKGAFTPARPTDWWCQRKFCGYFDSCPFASRPISVANPELIAPEL